MPNRTRSWLALPALLAALAVYFAAGAADLRAPGLYYDEAADALPALEFLTGQPSSAIRTVPLFGRQWPLMMLHHIGPASIYTSLAGFALLGASVEALRLTQLVVGALALVLLWRLARAWFDDETAAITVLLCGTAPVFVWWNRAGANYTAPLLPIALGMLMALRRAWRTRRAGPLMLGAFLFGAGVVTKILFVWLLAPMALAAGLILGPRGLWRAARSIRAPAWIGAGAALLLGLLPLILHNLPAGDTLRFLSANALQTGVYGHNNLDLAGNLRVVASEFLRLMGGDTLHFQAPAGLPLGAAALIASLVYVAARSLRDRALIRAGSDSPAASAARLRLFLWLSVAAVLPLSTVSTSSIGGTYLFVIVPLAWLLIAVSIRDGLAWLTARAGRRAAWLAGAGVVLAVAGAQALADAQIARFFSETGGKGLWSDAIDGLAEAAGTRYAGRPLAAMDWGFARNAAFLTGGRARMREMYELRPSPSPAFDDTASVLLDDPAHVYVFHAPHTTAFRGVWEAFDRAAQQRGLRLALDLAIPERDGTPHTLVYTAAPVARTFTVSPALATRNAAFGGGLTLLGGKVDYDAARNEVAVRLWWRSTAERLPDDTVLLHLVDQSSGAVVAVADQQPLRGYYPFSQWERGEVVEDPRWVRLPAALPAGIYQARVGVYDTPTGQRRPIDDPLGDAAGDSLMLDTFEVR